MLEASATTLKPAPWKNTQTSARVARSRYVITGVRRVGLSSLMGIMSAHQHVSPPKPADTPGRADVRRRTHHLQPGVGHFAPLEEGAWPAK